MTEPQAAFAERFGMVREQWLALTRPRPADVSNFERIKGEADTLIDAGLWTSGPRDLLSVIGRQRDELIHSRLIAWLFVPTNRHGLGRQFLLGFLDRIWPGEGLMRTGPVVADTEVPRSANDDAGQLREARADIVLQSGGLTIVIENKVDAGEQPQQCERLYWAWADLPGDTRWVFLTPSGRGPITATSDAAKAAWRTLSYSEVRDVLSQSVAVHASGALAGASTPMQYLATLTAAGRS